MNISDLLPSNLQRRFNGHLKKESMENDQFSLHDGSKIFDLIIDEITNAENSIYIAAAWFTDHDLLDALMKKYEQNSAIDIKVILDNNKDNFYLPFKRLVELGGEVRLVKKASAYGKMHHKFCIIDKTKLINGSYNWSKNARLNNSDNIVYTEDNNTVTQFLEQFELLFEGSTAFDPENLNQIGENDNEQSSEGTLISIEDSISEYEEIITKLIYAQVHSYDNNLLHNLGKERSKCCSGDAQNLQQELDNVYSSFLRDIKISNDKKELIKSSLHEQLERSKGHVSIKTQNDLSFLEKESNMEKAELEAEISNVRAEIVSLEAEITNSKDNEQKSLHDNIQESQRKIAEIENDNYRPNIPLYTFIPNLVFLALVLVYSIIFYSSAAYILIFSQDDAKQEKLNGGMIGSPEIFDGEAISKALEKGPVSLLFILLVPIFIVALIFVINKVENVKLRLAYLISVILFIDSFTAYKVAESIHRIEYLKGQAPEQWRFNMVWANSDFYLVLVFGLLALLTLEFLLSHLFKVLDGRNQDIKFLKSKLELGKERTILSETKNELKEIKNQVTLKLAETENRKADIALLEKRISLAAKDMERQRHAIEAKRDHQNSTFENITNINLTKIENENFTFSTIYVSDRISIYMRGWKDFLHEQFAVNIALKKSREADEQVRLWKSNNLKYQDKVL
jgi:CRISPR/Cas system CMR-associated protein Cmr5 small subunit